MSVSRAGKQHSECGNTTANYCNPRLLIIPIKMLAERISEGMIGVLILWDDRWLHHPSLLSDSSSFLNLEHPLFDRPRFVIFEQMWRNEKRVMAKRLNGQRNERVMPKNAPSFIHLFISFSLETENKLIFLCNFISIPYIMPYYLAYFPG